MTVTAVLDLARVSGVVLNLTGNEVRVAPPTGGVPRSLIEQLRTHKAAIRALLIAEKYGPLTRGGKMCRRCLTISRCRPYAIGYACDPCRRDDDEPGAVASPVTAPIMPSDSVAEALIAYALERIQPIADKHAKHAARMEVRFST